MPMPLRCVCGATNKAGHFERIAKQKFRKHEYLGPGKHALKDEGGKHSRKDDK